MKVFHPDGQIEVKGKLYKAGEPFEMSERDIRHNMQHGITLLPADDAKVTSSSGRKLAEELADAAESGPLDSLASQDEVPT